MGNINLNKINGEYVKFYITTNSSLPEILKNSGAIVIYNDETKTLSYNSSYTNNYIYLGNQLIASGWGLSTKELRDKLESIGCVWDDTLENIKTSYNSINDDIKNINNRIDSELIANDGIINNTYVYTTYNNEQILTRTEDILLNRIDYKYKTLEITEEKNIVKYSEKVNEEEKIYTIETSYGQPVSVPTGAKILSVSKSIKYDCNDDYPEIDDAKFCYYYNTYSQLTTTDNFENLKLSEGEYTDIDSTNNITKLGEYTFTMNYTDKFEDNDSYKYLFAKEGLQTVADYAFCYTKGTDLANLKNSSYIHDNIIEDLNIKSTIFINQGSKIDLYPIQIIGKPIVFSFNCEEKLEIIPEYKLKDIDIIGNRTLLEDTTKLYIDNNARFFYMALPAETNIDEIYYIDMFNNNHVNITSNFVELHNEDNYWFKKYVITNSDKLYMNYRVYCCRYLENQEFGNNLTIYVKTSNIQETVNTKYDSLDNPTIIPDINNWTIVQNNEYIDNNWIYSTDDINNSNNLFFKFVESNYKYYYSDSIIDNTFASPLSNWDNFNEYNINEIINDDYVIENINHQGLIIPYNIFKTFDFYTEYENELKKYYFTCDDIMKLDNIYKLVFTKQDTKFIKLFFNEPIIKMCRNTKGYCGDSYDEDKLDEFLNNNGLPYNLFKETYIDKPAKINSAEDKFRLIVIAPQSIKFSINKISHLPETEGQVSKIVTNNIFSKRINNVLYSVYKSIEYINKVDEIQLIQ